MKYVEEVKKHNFRPLATRPRSQPTKEDSFRESSDKKPARIPVKAKVTVLKYKGSPKPQARAALSAVARSSQ